MNKALALALIAAAAAATGCGSTKEKRAANPGVCPNALVLADAARVVEFDGEETIENVAYSGEFQGIQLDCRFYGTEPIDASVKVTMAFGKGPKGTSDVHPFTYFIAVTRTDFEVILKEEYTIPVEFDDDERVRIIEDKIKQIVIPRANETTAGTNFEVIVGFAVTPEQVIFNRSGKSLKFPEL